MFGCSRTGHIKGLVRCSGTATLNGKPLSNANIIFVPLSESQTGRTASGVTNANGFYNIATNGKFNGILPGEYKVIISKSVPASEQDAKMQKEIDAEAANGVVPPPDDPRTVNYKSLTGKYAQSSTSDLTVKITDNGTKNLDFKLTVEER
jgi:hypothetical protein